MCSIENLDLIKGIRDSTGLKLYITVNFTMSMMMVFQGFANLSLDLSDPLWKEDNSQC